MEEGVGLEASALGGDTTYGKQKRKWYMITQVVFLKAAVNVRVAPRKQGALVELWQCGGQE